MLPLLYAAPLKLDLFAGLQVRLFRGHEQQRQVRQPSGGRQEAEQERGRLVHLRQRL